MAESQEVFPSTSVTGLILDDTQMFSTEIYVDSSFEKCPIAFAAGIPLYVKENGRELREIQRRGYPLPLFTENFSIIVKMMVDSSTGFACRGWQYGGCFEPAPTVIVARSDKVAFGLQDWNVLDEFITKMLKDGPKEVQRSDFVDFVKNWVNQHSDRPNIVLGVLFPKEMRVQATGFLKDLMINGKRGQASGIYSDGKVGVMFDGIESAALVDPINFIPEVQGPANGV